MGLTINTNITSLSSQRNVNQSQSALSDSLKKLSSGLRINSAKDDAAGLAIAEKLTSQIKGSQQASRNANDAISLTQTAEGDLNQVTNNLQRIRELATQSLNSTNSASDRQALQDEVGQLVSEIDRTASTSSFNGIKLLDGTFTNQSFQVGPEAGQTINISGIASARASALGAGYSASTTGTATTGALVAGNLVINGTAVGASVAGSASGQSASSAYAIANAINSSSTGVTATANTTTVAGAAPAGNSAIAANAFSINGVNIGAIADGGNAAGQGSNVAAAINKVSAATGVTATFDNTTGAVSLAAADGRDIAIAGTVTNTGLTAATTRGTISLSTDNSAGITISGSGVANAGLTAGTTNASQTGTALSLTNISSAAGAAEAIKTVDAALKTVNSTKSVLGAYQNRFNSVISSLSTSTENMMASRSRIQDVDYASETANMTKQQILQQAGTAMLAQANSLPQSVLSLLR